MNAARFEKVLIRVDEISRKYDIDPTHTEHVSFLSLALFDELIPLHHYGENERRLLEIASRLHDIGWSQTVDENHNKLSGDMILETNIPGLDDGDKLTCALVARYHTKAIPDETKHEQFASLPAKTRNLVEWLAGILRVGDALDNSHTGVIRRLKLETNNKVITLRLYSNGNCKNEITRARRKEDLLVKKTAKQVVYECF